MNIWSPARRRAKWEEICGGNGISLSDWPSHLWTSCLREDRSRPMSAPYALHWMAAWSSALTPPSVCLYAIAAVWHLPPLPSPFPFLSPSPRFTHPSGCQALVRSGSPLAPWLGLPSNNFISFQPLSRRHAPPLTIGCCFITVGKKKKKGTGIGRAGWEPNNSWQRARHRALILMAAVGMYQPKVMHKKAGLCLVMRH